MCVDDDDLPQNEVGNKLVRNMYCRYRRWQLAKADKRNLWGAARKRFLEMSKLARKTPERKLMLVKQWLAQDPRVPVKLKHGVVSHYELMLECRRIMDSSPTRPEEWQNLGVAGGQSRESTTQTADFCYTKDDPQDPQVRAEIIRDVLIERKWKV